MKILIPPSEGKAKVRPLDILFKDTNFEFAKYTQQIVDLLCLIENEDLTSVYGTTQEKAMMFHRQNQDVFNSKCVPAIERYTGVVYNHIEWNTLSKKSKNYMQKYILIFSGLFGLLTPETLIPDYKLKMNVLSLEHHWKETLTKTLQDEDLVIDLLPQVHRKAYIPKDNVKKIDFIVIKKGKKSAAGHFGKAVKGQLIKYIVMNQITSTDQFDKFNFDGFQWDGEVFIKEHSS